MASNVANVNEDLSQFLCILMSSKEVDSLRGVIMAFVWGSSSDISWPPFQRGGGSLPDFSLSENLI